MFGFTDLQVKVGRHKIAMVGGVVAGEAGGARVVPSILPYTEHINQKGLGDTHVHIWTLCQKCALHVNTEQTFALRVYHVFQSGMFSTMYTQISAMLDNMYEYICQKCTLLIVLYSLGMCYTIHNKVERKRMSSNQ